MSCPEFSDASLPPTSSEVKPHPPYFAVIFTSVRAQTDYPGESDDGYEATATRMVNLAAEQEGFLGVESARNEDGLGITVSYWTDEESIEAWRTQAEHAVARQRGRSQWYQSFTVRVCRVDREYSFAALEKDK